MIANGQMQWELRYQYGCHRGLEPAHNVTLQATSLPTEEVLVVMARSCISVPSDVGVGI